MKYLCLVYQPEETLEPAADGRMDALECDRAAWVEELDQRGRHVLTVKLEPVRTAGSVRIHNGNVSVNDPPTSGPCEYLGGFTIIDARDLNEAIHLASQLPAARSGSVEVRPVQALSPD